MKWMVYPASRYVSVLARYREMISDCEEIRFVIPNGWGADGADFSTLDGGSLTGVKISHDFEGSLKEADAVLFAEGPIPLPERFLLERVNQAAQAGKPVVFEQLPEELRNKLPGQYEVLRDNGLISVKRPSFQDPEISTVPVPVVFVMGTGPHTNKLEVQAALGRYFQAQGYSVSHVASRNLGSFLGFHTIPESLFTQARTTRDKIILLNRYFHKVYLQDKPEVMILGLPGGIMPVNPVRFEDFGERAYLISQAVTPDATVLCSYTLDLTQEYAEEMQAVCRYRLGAVVKHLVISGTGMEISSDTRQTQYSMVPGSLIRPSCEAGLKGVGCYYALDSKDMETLGAAVLQELTENL